MINIKSYGNSQQNNDNVSNSNSNINNTELETHYLWGQPFNGTQDVDGDIETNGDITANNISAQDNISSNSLDVADTANIKQGIITTLSGTDLSFLNGTINNLITDAISNSGTITTKDLEVTGKAHFFELIIDKIKSAGGSVILTPADGFKVDKVDSILRNSGEIGDDDFIQLDYINCGNATLNLGYYPSYKTEVIADVTIPSTKTTKVLFGCRNSSTVNASNPAYIYWIYDTGGSSNLYSRTSYYDQTAYRGKRVKMDERQTIHFDKGVCTYTAYDDTTVTLGKTNEVEWSSNKPMGLFGLYQGSAMFGSWKATQTKLYRFTIKEDDVVIRDYVPCYRISTEQYGIYNLTDKTFIRNNAFTGSSLIQSYKVYWRATDGDKSISNMWKINDQAICQTFNAAEGTSYDVSNKYYWALVTDTGTETIDENDYHFITLSNEIVDGVLNPEVGDEIAMLGYRGTDDLARQSAIYIAAYNSIDKELTAPLYAQYRGINDFNLSAHKYTWFSTNSNQVQGNIKMVNGEDVQDAIDTIHIEKVTDYWLRTSLKSGISWETIGWETTPPELTEVLCYLWHYQETLYSDGHSDKTPPSITGNYSKDGEDNYNVYVYTVNGNLTLLGEREVDLYAELWKGAENISDIAPQTAYSWQRTSSDSEADETWNKTKVGIGRFLHLTDADVIKKSVFDCVVDIDIIKEYIN